MRKTMSLAAVAAAVVGAWVAPAGASPASPEPASGGGHALFVLTNDPTGNQVVSYRRDGRGALSSAGRYDTGGTGTVVPGAVVDPLASQGGLAYDAADRLLVAVNGGSDTVAAFRVDGSRLRLIGRVASGGSTPVSVAATDGRFYVLNAGGTGTVQGFSATTLAPLPGTSRDLGLTPGLTPAFLNTPGQIGVSPDGAHLVVTTKANGSAIDVFGIASSGALSAGPVVNPSATPVPFGFSFDRAGDLVTTEAATSSLTTYAIEPGGTLQELGSVSAGQAALCWVAGDGHGRFYGANAGSATVTGFVVAPDGRPGVVGETATDPGPVDLTTTPDGSALYVETGGRDLVDEFSIAADGSLDALGSVAPELPGHSGLEGIAAS